MICPNCGYDRLSEDARTCPRCLAELPDRALPAAGISVIQDVDQAYGNARVVGVDLGQVSGDVSIETIHQNIGTIVQRALTPAEEDEQARAIEVGRLREGVSAFARGLQAYLVEASTPLSGNPYKGLRPYGLGEAERFFGRHAAIRDLLILLQHERLTVLHSESGAGKSSLLQAGISPRLLEVGHLPVLIRPYDISPAVALKEVFVPELSQVPRMDRAPLRSFLRYVGRILGPEPILFVFIDQFEEFFTRLGEEERPSFVRDLADCLRDMSLRVHWVLSLRTEYFGRLASFRPGLDLCKHDFYLPLLTREEARQVIVAPADAVGVRFEDGLSESLLAELADQSEVHPPQVQLVCSALFEELAPGEDVITRALYEDQGGARQLLSDHLKRVLSRELPEDLHRVARGLLKSLIDENHERIRRTRSELVEELAGPEHTAHDIDTAMGKLTDAYLVHTIEIEDQDRVLVYELVHDYLAEQIELSDTERGLKAARALLEQKLRLFKEAEQRRVLLSADELAIIGEHEADLVKTPEARSLVQQSKRDVRRRQNTARVGVTVLLLLAISIIIAVSLLVGAVNARNIASTEAALAVTRESYANQAADEAQTRVAVAITSEAEANLAVGLALEREASAATREANAELEADLASQRAAVANEAIRRAFDRTGIVPVGDSPRDLAFDGQYIWVANHNDDTVQVIDPVAGVVLATFDVNSGPAALAFDGEQIWIASDDGGVQALDLESGPIKEIWDSLGPVDDMVYADGRLWVSSGGGNEYIGDVCDEGPPESWVQPIDLRTESAEDEIYVGCYRTDLATDGTRVWVSAWGTVFELRSGMRPINRADALFDFYTRYGEVEFDGQGIEFVDNAGPGASLSEALAQDLVYDAGRDCLWAVDTGKSIVWEIGTGTGLDSESTFRVGTAPSALVVAGDSLWVANEGDDTIQRVDLSSGVLSQPFRVGNKPWGLAFDGKLLWVANLGDDTVQAVEPETGAIRHTVSVGDGPYGMAYAAERVWATTEDGSLYEIDPAEGTVLRTISVGDSPVLIASDGQQLWITHEDAKGTLLGISIESGDVVHRLEFDWIYDILFDGERLWVAFDEGGPWSMKAAAVDPNDGSIDLYYTEGYSVEFLAHDGDSLWFGSNYRSKELSESDAGALVRLDRWGGGQVLEEYAFGSVEGLVRVGNQLWLVDNETLYSFDLLTKGISPSHPLGYAPVDMIFDGQRLWFSDGVNSVQYLDIMSDD